MSRRSYVHKFKTLVCLFSTTSTNRQNLKLLKQISEILFLTWFWKNSFSKIFNSLQSFFKLKNFFLAENMSDSKDQENTKFLLQSSRPTPAIRPPEHQNVKNFLQNAFILLIFFFCGIIFGFCLEKGRGTILIFFKSFKKTKVYGNFFKKLIKIFFKFFKFSNQFRFEIRWSFENGSWSKCSLGRWRPVFSASFYFPLFQSNSSKKNSIRHKMVSSLPLKKNIWAP